MKRELKILYLSVLGESLPGWIEGALAECARQMVVNGEMTTCFYCEGFDFAVRTDQQRQSIGFFTGVRFEAIVARRPSSILRVTYASFVLYEHDYDADGQSFEYRLWEDHIAQWLVAREPAEPRPNLRSTLRSSVVSSDFARAEPANRLPI